MDSSRRKFLIQAVASSTCFLWTGSGLSTVSKHNHWKLEVDGLIANPRHYDVADLKALSGNHRLSVSLSLILKEVKPLKRARYVVLHCAIRTLYIDMVTAYSGETMLVYDEAGMNVNRIELRDKAFKSIAA